MAFDIDFFNQMPFAQSLGFRFESADDALRCRLSVADQHMNTVGIAHGGLLPILIDAAGASNVADRSNARVITTQLQAHFLRPMREGDDLVATAEVPVISGSTAFAVVTVRTASEIVGVGHVVCKLRED